jgi:hypothetical protein
VMKMIKMHLKLDWWLLHGRWWKIVQNEIDDFMWKVFGIWWNEIDDLWGKVMKMCSRWSKWFWMKSYVNAFKMEEMNFDRKWS